MKKLLMTLTACLSLSAVALDTKSIQGHYELVESTGNVGDCAEELSVDEKGSNGDLLFVNQIKPTVESLVIFKFKNQGIYNSKNGIFFNYHKDVNTLSRNKRITKKLYGLFKIKRSQELSIDFSNLEVDQTITTLLAKKRKTLEKCTYKLR